MDLSLINPIVIEFASEHPTLATMIVLMGSMRMFAKPVVSAIRQIIVLTPSKADDVWLDKMEKKGWVKVLLYVLDWVSSIKITPKKKLEKEKS